jgi:hypothetical protein
MTITELLRKPWRQRRANLPVRNNQNTRRSRFTPQVEQLEERVNPHHIRLDTIPIVVESPTGTVLHVTGSATQINGTASWDLIAIESGTGTGFAKANVDFTPIVQHFSITVNNSSTVTPFSADIPIPYNPINTGSQQFYVKLVNNVGTLIDAPNPRIATIIDGTPPPVSGPAQGNINEGSTYTGSSSFSDASNYGPWSVVINYGDGTTPITSQKTSPGSISLSHLYPQDSSNQTGGVYHGTITVTDKYGVTGATSFEVLVNNVAPAFSLLPNETILVGQSVGRLSVPFTDPGSDGGFWLTPGPAQVIRLSDGQVVGTTAVTTNQDGKTITLAPFTFTQPGVYEVRVGLCDDDTVTYRSFQVTVLNCPPEVVAPDNGCIIEGSTFTASGSFSDNTGQGPWTVTIDYGDGSAPVTYSAASPGAIPLSHLYSQDSSNQPGGVYHGSITVSDEFGATGGATFTVTVLNVAPVVDAGADLTIGAGQDQSITQGGFFADPGADAPWNGVWTISLNGTVVSSGALSVDSNSKTFTLTTPAFNQPGDYVVTITINDDDSAGADTFVVHVVNAVPTVLPPIRDAIDEGTFWRSYATFADATGHGPWTIVIDYGTGGTPLIAQLAAPGVVPLTHFFAQDSSDQPGGVFRGTVTVIDEFGAVGTAHFEVLVRNVAPAPQAGGNVVLDYQQPLNRAANFTDPGADAPWTVRIDFGDGVVQQFQTNRKEFTFSHQYAHPGTYQVVVTVFDDETSNRAAFNVTVRPLVLPLWFFNPPENQQFLPPAPTLNQQRGTLPGQDLRLQEQDYWRNISGGGMELNQPPEVYYEFLCEDERTRLLDEGDTLIQDGYFNDPNPGDSHIGFVDFGDDTGWQALPLRVDKTFTLKHKYEKPGEYEVYVKVIDNKGAVGYKSMRVIVANIAPSVTLTGDRQITDGQEFSASGEFLDPGLNSWTATVDYGDGSAVKPLKLDGKSFKLRHKYARKGTYTVKVVVNDGSENGAAELKVEVTAGKVSAAPDCLLDHQWANLGEVMATTYGCEFAPESGGGSSLDYSVAALALGLLIPVACNEEKSSTKRQSELDRAALDEYFASFHK